MGITVAISAERDQIFVCVVTQLASRANVVDLKMTGAAAVLASPAVTLQHFDTEFAIRIRVQPKSRSSRSKISSLDSLHLLHEFHFLWIWKQ